MSFFISRTSFSKDDERGINLNSNSMIAFVGVLAAGSVSELTTVIDGIARIKAKVSSITAAAPSGFFTMILVLVENCFTSFASATNSFHSFKIFSIFNLPQCAFALFRYI